MKKKLYSQALPCIISFSNKLNKINNTGAKMLDSTYHLTLKLLENHVLGVHMTLNLLEIHVFGIHMTLKLLENHVLVFI